MNTASSHFHSQLLVLLLPVILVLILAATAEQQLKPMAHHQGCRRMCGNISIPFPFGIGPGCFRDGFEVLCDHSFDPPRAFLADEAIKLEMTSYFPPRDFLPGSWSLLELMSISVTTGEARAYASVSYRCSTNDMDDYSTIQQMWFYGTPFAVSFTRNILIGVGSKAKPQLIYQGLSGISCTASGTYKGTPTNVSCSTGQGCCEATLPPDDGPVKHSTVRLVKLFSTFQDGVSNSSWATNPCNYAMLVEKSWYNFSKPDMYGNMTLLNKFPRGVPLALDFAAGNDSCPAQGKRPPRDYACVSSNSRCANATYDGYICKCWDHYDGNPYVHNGCQDIDECKFPEVYPCSSRGICKNRLGGYDCPCKFGMKGDGKAGTCTDVFTPAAKATVGTY